MTRPYKYVDVNALYHSTPVSAWLEFLLHERDENVRTASITHRDVQKEAAEYYEATRLISMPVLAGTEWILDTGTGRHLSSRDSVCGKVFATDSPIILMTAAGDSQVDEATMFSIPALGPKQHEALVLEQSPHALSLGILVQKEGFSQAWSPEEGFRIWNKKGTLVPTYVKDFVPRLATPGEAPSETFVLPASRFTRSDLIVAPAVEEPAELVPDAAEPVSDDEGILPIAPDLEQRLRAEAVSLKHLCTHKPSNRYCNVCQEAKCRKQGAFRRKSEDKHTERLFGDLLHFDHGTMRQSKDAGFEGELKALHVIDHATRFKGCFPDNSKSTAAVKVALRLFLGKVRVKAFRSDNAPELLRAGKDMQAVHFTSTPYTPANNSTIERLIQETLHDIRSCLHQAGLPPTFWSHAAPYVCHASNTLINRDKEPGSVPPYRIKYPNSDHGPTCPFGALVHFRLPGPFADQAKFAPVTTQGLWLGVHLQPGLCYHGDGRVVDLNDMRLGVKPRIHRLRIQEIRFPPLSEIEFPCKIARDLSWTAQLKQALECKIHLAPIELPSDTDAVLPPAAVTDDAAAPQVAAPPTPPASHAASSSLPITTPASAVAAETVSKIDKSSMQWRPNNNSSRPPDIHPDCWSAFGPKARRAELDRRAALLTDGQGDSSGSGSAFSPAVVALQPVHAVCQRVFVEYACADDSLLSQIAVERGVFGSVRLTRSTADLSTAKGHQIAVDKVLQFDAGLHCDVHVALPCTPWCPWHRINIHKFGKDYERKLNRNRKVSLTMIRWLVRFMVVVRKHFCSSSCMFEWPKHASGGLVPQVKTALK